MDRIGLGSFAATWLVLSLACDWLPAVRKEIDKNLQAKHTAALLEGYHRYRTLLDDPDTEVVWFDYQLPANADALTAAEAVANRIAAHNGCFRRAVEPASDALRLRCPGGEGEFKEYLIGVLPKPRTVVVMYAAISGPAENFAYPHTVASFKQRLLSLRQE